MRNILDTNILVSALIVPGGGPDYLYQCWRTGRFTLISSEEQLEEFRRVTRYPRLQNTSGRPPPAQCSTKPALWLN